VNGIINLQFGLHGQMVYATRSVAVAGKYRVLAAFFGNKLVKFTQKGRE